MESLSQLREVLTCVVCLDTLVSPVVQCNRGHAICGRCQHGQRHCPSCRRLLLPDKPILLCQLLEVVTDRCKYPGCVQVLEGTADDHQTWCQFRPTQCKLCPWAGTNRDISVHVYDAHRDCAVIGQAGNVADHFYNCLQARRSYVPFSIDNLFFWIHLKTWDLSWDSSSNLLALKFILIPIRKMPNDLYIKVRFQSENCNTTVTKKIEVGQRGESEKNCIFIPELVLNGRNDFFSVDVVQESRTGAPIINNPSTQYFIQLAVHTFLHAIKRNINQVVASYQNEFNNYMMNNGMMTVMFAGVLIFVVFLNLLSSAI